MNQFDHEDDIEQARRQGKTGNRYAPRPARIDPRKHAALVACLDQRAEITRAAEKLIDSFSFAGMVEALKMLNQVIAEPSAFNPQQLLLARSAARRISERTQHT